MTKTACISSMLKQNCASIKDAQFSVCVAVYTVQLPIAVHL